MNLLDSLLSFAIMTDTPEKKSFTQKTLTLLRTDNAYSAEENKRKKKTKLSRIITIIDATIVILLLVFFSTRNGDRGTENASGIVTHGNLTVKFSMMQQQNDSNESEYVFSLTLSAAETGGWTFADAVGKFNLLHKGNVFYEGVFSPGAKTIELLAGEAKTFPVHVSAQIIDRALESDNGKRKTLFSFGDVKTVTARSEINLINAMGSVIEFDFKREMNK